MSLTDKQRDAAAVLMRVLNLQRSYCENFAAGLTDAEIAALSALPDDPGVQLAVALIVKASRIRWAARPLAEASAQFLDGLDAADREFMGLCPPPIAGGNVGCIGPRTQPFPVSETNRKIRRSIG